MTKHKPTSYFLEKYLDRIRCGDSNQLLQQMPAACVDTVVTSPPYYQQRNYEGQREQIGQESTPQGYIDRLVALFRETHRVLRDTGSLWLVLGDKYQDGQQLGMPWRVALALQQDGWILRSDVIWHKPNAMPSSVKNRLTLDHEYVFFFVKSMRYHYDADAIREPHVTFSDHSRMKGGRQHFFRRGSTPEQGKNGGTNNLHDGRWDQAFHPKGRNKRTVWSVPLSKCREAHFAVFPAPLVRTCILATCPEQGLVLDPFCGSGTTCAVAQELGRHFVGFDCVEKYCRMAAKRTAAPT
ncbi:MAG: site-specific DNA-methyltransferase [Planctomycetota bacterium]|nr:site-specific DNA-methyltransferase [Planctomycetota bacterium]